MGQASKHIRKVFPGWKRTCRYLDAIKTVSDAESIHKFRLEVKKIEALIFLLRKCEYHEKLRFRLTHTRKLFKHLGSIRTAMLNLRMLESYNLNHPEFVETQRKELDSRFVEFIAFKATYLSRIRKELEKLGEALPGIDTRSINKAYIKLYRATSRFFSEEIQEEKLHDLRKRIKFLIYTAPLPGKKTKKAIGPGLEHLNLLQEKIGQWHDVVVLVELLSESGHLNKTLNNKLKKQSRNNLQAIKQAAGKLAPS